MYGKLMLPDVLLPKLLDGYPATFERSEGLNDFVVRVNGADRTISREAWRSLLDQTRSAVDQPKPQNEASALIQFLWRNVSLPADGSQRSDGLRVPGTQPSGSAVFAAAASRVFWNFIAQRSPDEGNRRRVHERRPGFSESQSRAAGPAPSPACRETRPRR
jgi:hypothetical protein